MEKNSYIYESTKEILQREIDACKKLLEDTKDKWNEYIDLKLHEASTANVDFEHNDAKVTFDDDAQTRWFYDFCETSYDWFVEDLREAKGIDFDKLRQSLGTTSKFYLGNLHVSERTARFWVYVLAEASETFCHSDVDFTDDLQIEDIESNSAEEIEEYVASMLELIKYLRKEVEATLEPIIFAYDTIKTFKDNQVEEFRDYVRDGWLNNVY